MDSKYIYVVLFKLVKYWQKLEGDYFLCVWVTTSAVVPCQNKIILKNLSVLF